MAEGSAPKYPDSQAFLRAVARHLGTGEDKPTDTWKRLVEIGALPIASQRKFDRWWGGRQAPDHRSTMAILEATGLLPNELLQQRSQPSWPTSLPLWRTFLQMLPDTELTPELCEAMEAVAAEMETSAGETQRVAVALRERLARADSC